jgi:hypothetical protein
MAVSMKFHRVATPEIIAMLPKLKTGQKYRIHV